MVTAKRLTDDELQNRSSIIISAVGNNGTSWPENPKRVNEPSVVLSNTKEADLPKGE